MSTNPYKGESMLSAKLTSKGQITIPKKVRDKMGISPGEALQFEEKDGVFYIRKALRKSPFDQWAGYLEKATKKESNEVIEEMRGK